MEERKKIVAVYVSKGLKVANAVKAAGLHKSTYYYKFKGSRPGKTPLENVIKNEQSVPVTQMTIELENILGREFNDYGYHRATWALRNEGYKVNFKRIYRIMKEKGWLFAKRRAPALNKKYVEFSSPLPDGPLRIIEADFKYIYIHGENRNAYFISLLDTFTRMELAWDCNYNMKKERVQDLITKLLKTISPNEKPQFNIVLRTDNGSQFIARTLKRFLEENEISHEFIRPATPQQNGHIESFHSTLQNCVCDKYYFENIEKAREILARFIEYYNSERIMEAILNKSPIQFWRLWEDGKVTIERKHKKQIYIFKEGPPETGGSSYEAFIGLSQNYKQKIVSSQYQKN